MTLSKTLFSSKSDEWRTPDDLFDILNREFAFTLDVAATEQNALCAEYYTKQNSALLNPWHGSVWCNPPYSRKLAKEFVLRAVTEMRVSELQGPTLYHAVFLLPARTDTILWQELIFPHADQVRFLRGRLKFLGESGEETGTAPFPSAIVVFSQDRQSPVSSAQCIGWDWKNEPNKFL